jgi:hypothetical protein
LRRHRPDLPADDADLTSIADDLGDLPLALHLAGSYLARYRNTVTPSEYLLQLDSQSPVQHRSLQQGGISPTRHTQHVARTFELSFERLNTTDPLDMLARALLARAIYFAPGEPIPQDLLLATLGSRGETHDMILQAEDALARLVGLGLLEELTNGNVRLHRLLLRFLRGAISEEEARASTLPARSPLEFFWDSRGVAAAAAAPSSHH